MFRIFPGLWDGTIVPDVAFVREAIGYKSGLAFFDILLDWVELFG